MVATYGNAVTACLPYVVVVGVIHVGDILRGLAESIEHRAAASHALPVYGSLVVGHVNTTTTVRFMRSVATLMGDSAGHEVFYGTQFLYGAQDVL